MKVISSSVSAAFALLLLFLPAGFSQLRSSPSFERDTLTLTFTSASPVPFRAVTGAPYSGTQTMEMVQTLANGTTLRRGQTDTVTSRDSLGRVRTERAPVGTNMKLTPAVVVEISDPVAGFSIILDSVDRVAHRVPLKSVPAPPMPATMPQRSPSTNTLPNGVVAENVPLGNRVISGVEASGTRMTMTYPPGSVMGNDQPVANVSETWFALRLGMVVLSKTSSPGMGDALTAWKDLSLAEPNPELFRIPAEYKIVDEPGPFSVKFLRQR